MNIKADKVMPWLKLCLQALPGNSISNDVTNVGIVVGNGIQNWSRQISWSVIRNEIRLNNYLASIVANRKI